MEVNKLKRFLAIILSLSTTLALAGSAYAFEGGNEPSFLEDDSYSEIIESLNPGDYGGIYMEGDVLHITAVDPAKLERSIPSMARSVDIIIQPAQYTYEELRSSQGKLENQMQELDIFEIYTNPRTNSLVVTSPTWNEEKQEAVREVTGIQNLEFVTEENTNDVVVDAICGDKISTSHGNYSLACSVVWNKSTSPVYGFVTAGHGNSIGDEFYYLDSDYMGEITKMSYSGNLDVALIERNANAPAATTELCDGSSITHSGAPVVGNKVTHFGFKSSSVDGEIISIDATVMHTTGVTLKNMIKSSAPLLSGDSGGPVVAYRDGNNILVGINSSTNGTTSHACRFDLIKNKYDLNVQS